MQAATYVVMRCTGSGVKVESWSEEHSIFKSGPNRATELGRVPQRICEAYSQQVSRLKSAAAAAAGANLVYAAGTKP